MERLKERRMFVDSRGSRTVPQIASQARRHQREHGLALLIVDYIGLIMPTDARVPRHEQLGQISRGLKRLGGDLNVPVLALCQLSRAGSADGVRPQLHMLRESGELENNADVVMFLFRERHEEAGHFGEPIETELIIEKNRSGPTGVVKLLWQKHLVRFDEVANDWDRPEDSFEDPFEGSAEF